MGLFRKNKKENLVRNYPTKEEYLAEINRIQSEELNSDRYAKVRTSLEKHYWNRENKDLEQELFKIVGTYFLYSTSCIPETKKSVLKSKPDKTSSYIRKEKEK